MLFTIVCVAMCCCNLHDVWQKNYRGKKKRQASLEANRSQPTCCVLIKNTLPLLCCFPRTFFLIYGLISFPLLFADSSCLWNQFACSKNKCIAKQWLCDGENDCEDGLDESAQICGQCPYKCHEESAVGMKGQMHYIGVLKTMREWTEIKQS